jgi:hypothetical protein
MLEGSGSRVNETRQGRSALCASVAGFMAAKDAEEPRRVAVASYFAETAVASFTGLPS